MALPGAWRSPDERVPSFSPGQLARNMPGTQVRHATCYLKALGAVRRGRRGVLLSMFMYMSMYQSMSVTTVAMTTAHGS